MPPKTNRVSKRTSKAKTTKTKTAQSIPTSSTTDPDGPIYFWKPQESETGYLSQWYSLPFRDRDQNPTSTPSPTDIPGNNININNNTSNGNGKIYATAEHYMMHHKALLFGDAEIASAILEAHSPRDVKALGRAVRGFEEAVWARERARIVAEGNYCKFSFPVLSSSSSPSPSSPSSAEVEEEEAVVVREGKDGKKDEEKNEEEEEGGGGGGKIGRVKKIWKLGEGATPQTFEAAGFRAVLLATGNRELVEASPFDRIWGIGFAAKNAGAKRAKWGQNLLGKCLMDVREQFRREAEAEAEGEGEVEEEDGGEGEGEGEVEELSVWNGME